MSFAVDPTKRFLRELKQLQKRHASILDDVEQLGEALSSEPHQGTSLGRGCYKIRMAIRSKGRGKSGGARVISCVVAVRETVYLLSIFDKADQASLSDAALKAMLQELDLE